MRYDAQTGTVIYRSKLHAGLERNFQLMPDAEWLELILRHVPDRYEHLVRYIGWYSNRARGERAKSLNGRDALVGLAVPVEPVSEFAARAKAAWARLIRKVYEADPLECPKCKGPMRAIALSLTAILLVPYLRTQPSHAPARSGCVRRWTTTGFYWAWPQWVCASCTQ